MMINSGSNNNIENNPMSINQGSQQPYWGSYKQNDFLANNNNFRNNSVGRHNQQIISNMN